MLRFKTISFSYWISFNFQVIFNDNYSYLFLFFEIFYTPLSLIPPIFLNNELSVPNILEMKPCTDLIMIGKKDPNSLNIPYASTRIPTMGHPNRTNKIPQKKQTIPLSFSVPFFHGLKNLSVLEKPIMSGNAPRNRILPNANKALSKKKMTLCSFELLLRTNLQ